MSYQTKSYSSHRSGGNYHARPRFNGGGGNSRPQAQRRGPKKDYIDPRRFIKVARITDQADYTPQHAFSDFALNPLLKTNLAAKGYDTPSPIQDQTIPAALTGRDIIGVADTGTGKTAAFALPVLNAVMLGNDNAIIIAPTRELAQQIDAELRSLAKGSNLRGAVLIGGASMGAQLRDLRNGAQIVVGTPGRIKDHLDRGSLRLSGFKYVVLDEVDRMLDMGFVHDVSTILKSVNPERQSFFFSATLDAKVTSLLNTFAVNPVTVTAKTGETGENIHQDVIRVQRDSDKTDRLHDLLIQAEVQKAIIFDDTQRSVEKLSNELVARGFKADAIHGGKSQGQRQRSMHKFRQNEVNILIATDVAARGIDVSDITHVINFSTPASYSDYVHRIGRAGRAGKVGYALTFITEAEAGGSYVQR